MKISVNMANASHQELMSLTRRRFLLVEGVKTKRPSKRTCDSGLVWTMLTDSRSLKSTNFPLTIWLTVLAGTGEKPGPRTKGCCKSESDGKLVAGAVLTTHGLVAGTRELSANTELVTAGEGFAKVETKDGTT